MCFQRGAAIDSTDFSGINDDEMLAAVLEISRQEAGLSAPPPLDDEPTSSPDTGFGDTDAHDLAYHADLLEADSKQPAGTLMGYLSRDSMSFKSIARFLNSKDDGRCTAFRGNKVFILGKHLQILRVVRLEFWYLNADVFIYLFLFVCFVLLTTKVKIN